MDERAHRGHVRARRSGWHHVWHHVWLINIFFSHVLHER